MTGRGPVPGAATPGDHRADRERIIADHDLRGDDFRRTLTELTDAWLADLFHAVSDIGDEPGGGIALVALGGYGRGALWPDSDLDLAVVHRRRAARADRIERIARGIWYPVWDTGVHLGHGVRSVDDAVRLVARDVESATALLDARLIAGDPTVVDELATRVGVAWRAALPGAIGWLRRDASRRRARFGDVAHALEPNLKVGGGGLRDAQIPGWLAAGTDETLVDPSDGDDLDDASRMLADVRLAQHRHGSPGGEVLHLEKQDEVAAALGFADADALMTAVAAAGRDIDWVLDEMWVRAALVESAALQGRRRRRDRHGTDHGRIATLPTGDPGDIDVADPVAVLHHAAAVARASGRPRRPVLRRVADALAPPEAPWDGPVREAFTGLLSAGPGVIRVVEALDHVGVWERFVPEWPAVRSRAQRSPYHRFTVDRHLLETVANTAATARSVSRPDLLVVAALHHDLGKGRGGDHTTIGRDLVAAAGLRMGFPAADRAVLATLVERHLLLPEVATRRDLDDPATIAAVAATIGSVELLELLAALTEADARATGPAAWTEWKAGLVYTLVDRVRMRLAGGSPGPAPRTFPSAEQRRLVRAGATTVRGGGRTVTVIAPDRRRLFCDVTGALVIAGLNVVSATAASDETMAVAEFTVDAAFAPTAGDGADRGGDAIDWAVVTTIVEDALAGRIPIAARIAARAHTYRGRPRGGDDSVRVDFDEVPRSASGPTTVVEVDAPDRVGALFAITRVFADLGVDVRYARVETRADRVTDAFAILDATGSPIRDAATRATIAAAIHTALGA